MRVPSNKTSYFVESLKRDKLIFEGAGIIAINDKYRAIPLSESAPQQLPDKYSKFEIIDIEGKIRQPTIYIDRLKKELTTTEFKKNEHLWPTSHDQMGDMIIIKIPSDIIQYSSQIGQSLLDQHSRIRIVLLDNGVRGEWRVRDLQEIALRKGKKPSTLIAVKESGNEIWVDPTKVYYSPRLETERQETLDSAIQLKEKIGRPLNVIDPYAGVGPGLVRLFSHPGLVDCVYASDLNPETTTLLEKNLRPFEPSLSKLVIDCADALTLANDKSMRNKFDLLLVNLPHNTLEHISHLIPLLVPGVSLLKGWMIINKDEINLIKANLSEIITPLKANLSEIIITAKRTYAPHLVYASVELHFA